MDALLVLFRRDFLRWNDDWSAAGPATRTLVRRSCGASATSRSTSSRAATGRVARWRISPQNWASIGGVAGHLDSRGVARRMNRRKMGDGDVSGAALRYRNGNSLAAIALNVDAATTARSSSLTLSTCSLSALSRTGHGTVSPSLLRLSRLTTPSALQSPCPVHGTQSTLKSEAPIIEELALKRQLMVEGGSKI